MTISEGRAEFTFATRAIERVAAPVREEFEARYRELRQPIILEGAARHWPACSAWTLGALKARIGEREVGVYRSLDGYFPGLRADPHDGQIAEQDGRTRTAMPFAEFARTLSDPASAEAARHYLYHMPLEAMPDLARDYEVPVYFRDAEGSAERAWVRENLWISESGCVTPLHFDSSDNLLVQISGCKRVVLFAPDQYANLYPYGADDLYARHSQVFNLRNPNLQTFARLSDALGLVGTLNPGDMLYLPSYYWHYVESLETAISLNFFVTDLGKQGGLLLKWAKLVEQFRRSAPSDVPDWMVCYLLRATL